MGGHTRKIKGTGSAFGKTGGYKPFSSHKEGAGHSDQPQGKSVGYGSKRSYAKGYATGDGREPGQGWVAGAGKGGHGQAKHSSLTYNTNDSSGHKDGTAKFGSGSSFKGRLGPADSFRGAGNQGQGYSFPHQGGLKQGALRMSGDPRAHRVGSRKK